MNNPTPLQDLIYNQTDTTIKNLCQKEYNRLVKNSEFLSALQAVGVDNWEGYSDAWKMCFGDEF